MSLLVLSVIIPARDEEGSIASTVEHLRIELELRGVPHEVIVDDDGSTDRTWQILQQEAARLNPQPSSPPSPQSLKFALGLSPFHSGSNSRFSPRLFPSVSALVFAFPPHTASALFL